MVLRRLVNTGDDAERYMSMTVLRKMNAKTINRRRAATERGAQFVELAIVVPILFMLIAAVAEFGNYFYTYSMLTKSTRVAARYLTASTYDADQKTAAANLAVCGNPSTTAGACGSSTILNGLATSNVEITNTGSNVVPTTVTVRIINYNYRPVINLSKWTGGLLNNVSVSPSTTMRYMPWR